MANLSGPQRIVCLTEETTETLYLLGEDSRVVGVSGFTCRPKEARSKPRVSAFTSAKIDRILALHPDLVIGFSNLQGDIARDLIQAGLNVMVFNQRSIAEILQMIATLARIVGAESKGNELIDRFQRELDQITASAARFRSRPRVFFEEWMDPLISGIRWVEELVEIAGGIPIFPELRTEHDARKRIVDAATVVDRNPEVIVASWCGRKVKKAAIRNRQRWNSILAVQNDHVFEVKSTYILQPGPAALTEGVRQIHAILCHTAGVSLHPDIAPLEPLDPDIGILQQTISTGS